MKPLSRTHCQVKDATYRLYPINSPMWYKKPDGTFDDIDLTFNDATSTIGEISLMNKGIASVGKRKGNNPSKIVGIRPDGTQHLGTQQLEFSLINVELDDESQEFNVETDLELKLENSRIYQLVKLNKHFRNCKIEFDIYTKGIELQNNKYTSTTKIADYGFNLTNIGENNGNTTLGLHNSYSRLDKDIPYFDCNVGKITDSYITTGEYSLNEEFGNSDLSNYIINENMYSNGSAVYYKDSIIFTIQSYNIENYEDIIKNNLCSMYGLEDFDDGGSGKYLTKDNKKVMGYIAHNNVFFGFVNTADISDEIKTLFKRKSFEDTSFLDISLTDFCNDMENTFNKNLSIEVDSNYYEPIDDNFDFKVSENSYYISNPIAFDSDYNNLNYYTTHTLTDNNDGSYRYTKYLKPESSLNVNTAQYLDADLALSQTISGRFNASTGSSFATKNITNLMNHRNRGSGTGYLNYTANDSTYQLCGDSASRTVSSGQFGSTTTFRFFNYQSHFRFDTSGITDNVSSASFKFRGFATDDRGISTSGSSQNDDCSIIFLKSAWDGTAVLSSGSYASYNDWDGISGTFTTSSDPDDSWGESDVTLYSGEIQCDVAISATNFSASLNSTATTDIKNLSTFIIGCIEYDQFWLKTLDTSYTHPSGSSTGTNERMVRANMHNASTASYRPYLEYETGDAPSAPINNATFFGTNF